jgi:cystathionine beta-lyase
VSRAGFDPNPPDRRGTDSLKWGKYAGRDILPLWVADMDFAAPPAVLAALERRLAHGVLGYGTTWPALAEAVTEHLAQEYDWAVEPAWLVWLPGLVPGLNIACRAVAGTAFVQTPVYPPFLSAPVFSGRKLARIPLACARTGNRLQWEMDHTALEAAITSPPKRKNGEHCHPHDPDDILLFCHPHNPVGRAWRRDELEWLAAFAERHDLIVCSDEIHCDLILDEGKRHIPFAALGARAAARSITLMAPSKTFNIPGLSAAFAVIPEAGLRQRFVRAMSGIVPHVNVFGLVATEAAFREGGAWRQELLACLRQNRECLEAALTRLPPLVFAHVEASYLAWIDARALGLENPVAHFEAHGLGLSNGADFGAPGWVRLNFGCAPSTLDTALHRLEHAVHSAAAGAAGTAQREIVR